MSFVTKPVLLILEDEEGSRFIYEELLGIRYHLQMLKSLADLRTYLTDMKDTPALLIADMKLGDGFFLDLLHDPALRALLRMPFVVVSSIDDRDILRTCFSFGAADYMVKPLRPSEVVVKVDRLVDPKRVEATAVVDNPAKKTNDVQLDTLRNQLIFIKDETSLQLTPTETRIMATFISSTDRSVKGDALRQELWSGTRVGRKALDTHLFNLRRKLRSADFDIFYLNDDIYLFGPALLKQRDEAGR